MIVAGREPAPLSQARSVAMRSQLLHGTCDQRQYAEHGDGQQDEQDVFHDGK
jgi:hypothetical protein